MPGLNTEDWLYEVGKGWVAEGFDDRLIGAAKGADLAFAANPTGLDEPADFSVQVTNVQEMQLPEVTDEWVSEHLGEFDTLDAWKAAIAERCEFSAELLPQLKALETRWAQAGQGDYRIEVAGAVEESSKGSASIAAFTVATAKLAWPVLLHTSSTSARVSGSTAAETSR